MLSKLAKLFVVAVLSLASREHCYFSLNLKCIKCIVRKEAVERYFRSGRRSGRASAALLTKTRCAMYKRRVGIKAVLAGLALALGCVTGA